jgi:hypothetical protein
LGREEEEEKIDSELHVVPSIIFNLLLFEKSLQEKD